MLFSDFEYGFQEAFLAAWNAYKRGSMPIGCAIVNGGVLVARGENSIYAADKNEVVSGHRLAHAELNAILKVNADDHPNIGSYTLYTTMEPCALCYGAIVHGYIRKVKYAMKDNYYGGTALNDHERFKKLNIDISGPVRELEILEIALLVYRRLCHSWSLTSNKTVFGIFSEHCPEGVEIGHGLYGDNSFKAMIAEDLSPIKIYDYILGKCT
jgi:tRNA(adenine34) deaminase